MDKKKLAYRVAIVAVLVLGYFNYFGEEKKIEKQEEIIETKGAVYDTDGYHIEADVQKDFLKKDETTFEKAKAFLGDMVLTGDNALLDAGKNLLLNSNILGKSLNGWEIKTQKLNYEREKDLISSNAGVTAINKKDGVEISGSNFTSDTKLNNLVLSGDVKFKMRDIVLSAESAKYNDKEKIVNILGEAYLEGTNLTEDGSVLKGKFKGIKYDTKTNLLTTNNKFEIDYNGTKLFGDNLVLNDKTENFKITKNVYVLADNFKIDMESITSDGGDKIYFNGPVKGNDGIYSFTGDEGVYNKKDKKFYLNGNVLGKSTSGATLSADEAIYDLTKKDLRLVGKNKDLVIRDKDSKFVTKDVIYNTQSGIAYLTSGYIEDSNYILRSKKIEYKKDQGLILLPENYTLEEKGGQGAFYGTRGEYSLNTGVFTSLDKVKYVDGDNTVTGENIEFDKNTGEGIIKNNLTLINDSLVMKGKTGIYKTKEKKFYIPGEINFKDSKRNISGKMYDGIYDTDKKVFIGKKFTGKDMKNNLKSDIIEYRLSDSKVLLKNNLEIKTEGYLVNGNIAEIDLNTKVLDAKNVIVTSDTKDTFRGDKVVGSLDNMNLDFTGNVKGQTYQDGEIVTFSGDLVRGYFKKDELGKTKVQRIEIRNNAIVKKGDSTFYADYLEIQKDKNLIFGKDNLKGIMKDKNGVVTEITALLLNGNLKTEIIDLVGKVHIKRVEKNQVVITTSEEAEINNKNGVIELRGNVFVDNGESTIEADEVDYNTKTDKVKARGNVFVDYKTK
nr:LPS export ABC transporter periplasmic protein LptC [uncultured Cetobacterium sp.]